MCFIKTMKVVYVIIVLPSNARPKCPRYCRFDTAPSPYMPLMPQHQDDLAWSIGQSLARSRSEILIPMWAAYNSEESSSTLPLTTVAMMPLLAAPGHEWSTMLTVLKQVQNITTVVMEDSHKTVITFDLQLYEKAIKLQLYAYCTSIRSLCFPTWRATYDDDSIACSWNIHWGPDWEQWFRLPYLIE